MKQEGIFNVVGALGLLYALFALISWDIWLGDWHWVTRLLYIIFSLKAIATLIVDDVV